MDKIIKGICHSCYYRHRCCKHCPPKDDVCKYWKLGKCYTCKFVDDDEDAWYKKGCESECFGGCRQYKRDWNKTFEILRGNYEHI